MRRWFPIRSIQMKNWLLYLCCQNPRVRNIERDLRNPTLDTLLRITDAIEVDLGELITQARKEVSKPAKSK
jgi:transcriptional regulator with XRE-family HTH domain